MFLIWLLIISAVVKAQNAVNVASRNLFEDSWTLVREMEGILCMIYNCKFNSRCTYKTDKIQQFFDNSTKEKIYNDVESILNIFDVSINYEEASATIDREIVSSFIEAEKLISSVLLRRFKRFVEDRQNQDMILSGYTAKTFLNATFYNILEPLASEMRTQDYTDALIDDLIFCQCPINYEGKHCERCHKTSTVMMDDKENNVEPAIDVVDTLVWRE